MPDQRATCLIPAVETVGARVQTYRPDIDGLRAIAVALVVAFHLFPVACPAGFVGVDIFFVISGFLIGGILYREATNDGISILNFYCRRAVRILPAFLVVVVATWLIGWFLLFADEYQELGKDIAASSVFAGNFRSWASTGYFARESEMQPLLHLWSLGVEEQFYIAIPLVIGILAACRRRLLVAIAVLTLSSFLLGWYASIHHPSAAFYWPVTRAWELLAGVILSVLMHCFQGRIRTIPVLSKHLISLVGCVFLGAAMLLIKPGPGFPGLGAILPVMATCCLIAAGPEAVANCWLLSLAPMRYVGLVSYPWYLWHWPLLILWKIASGDAFDMQDSLWIAALSFLLAAMTMHFVELPTRRSTVPIKRRAMYLAAGLLPLLTLGLLAAYRIPQERLSSVSAFAAAQQASSEKWFYPFQDNHNRTTGFRVDANEAGTGGAPVVLFAGDSHMQHYWPRVKMAADELGEKRLHWRFVTAGGHPMLPGVNRIDPDYNCGEFFRFVLAEAKRDEVRRVVLSCAWQIYFLGPFPAVSNQDHEISWLHLEDEPRKRRIGIADLDPVLIDFESSLRELTELGKEVIVVLPSASSTRWDPKRISRWHPELLINPESTSVPQAEFDIFISPLRSRIAVAARQAGALTLDPCEYLAENGVFAGLEDNGRFRYRDKNHFRAYYVKRQATFIDGFLTL